MNSRVYQAACLFFVLFASSDRCLAGGFDQFDQSISLLFDPAKVAVDTTLWYGVPDRRFVSVNAAPQRISASTSSCPPFRLNSQLFMTPPAWRLTGGRLVHGPITGQCGLTAVLRIRQISNDESKRGREP
jgi:hypothetical protein